MYLSTAAITYLVLIAAFAVGFIFPRVVHKILDHATKKD